MDAWRAVLGADAEQAGKANLDRRLTLLSQADLFSPSRALMLPLVVLASLLATGLCAAYYLVLFFSSSKAVGAAPALLWGSGKSGGVVLQAWSSSAVPGSQGSPGQPAVCPGVADALGKEWPVLQEGDGGDVGERVRQAQAQREHVWRSARCFDERLREHDPALHRQLALPIKAEGAGRAVLESGDLWALGLGRDWPLLQKSLENPFYADITCDTPLMLLVPPLGSATIARLAQAGDTPPRMEDLVGQRLLHAARLIRLARDLVHLRLGTGQGGKNMSDDAAVCSCRAGEHGPPLVHVWVPDDLLEHVCRVVRDEFADWSSDALCRPLSSFLLPDRGDSTDTPAACTEQQRPGSAPAPAPAHSLWSTVRPWMQVLTGLKALLPNAGHPRLQPCSYIMWGVARTDSLSGPTLAARLCPTGVGIQIDLDKGDSVAPDPLKQPFWTPVAMPSTEAASQGPEGQQPAALGEAGAADALSIVTAFSQRYADAGLKLVRTLLVQGKRSGLHFSTTVYLLGQVSEDVISKLACLAKGFRDEGLAFSARNFDFSQFPSWMHIDANKAGWWGWKGVMLWESMVFRRRPVLWLDAGDCMTRSEVLQMFVEKLRNSSFLAFHESGLGLNLQWTHANASMFLGQTVNDSSLQYAGSGFGMAPDMYAPVLRPMLECSLTLQCIQPDGASYWSHRPDQSVMAILASASGAGCDDYNEWVTWGLRHKGAPGETCNIEQSEYPCSVV